MTSTNAWRGFALATLLLLVPVPLDGQTVETDERQETNEREDTLRPGDVISLRIWREPDLSGEFPVDEDGIVVFPRIGPRQVMGKPLRALQEELVEEYSETLRNPSIEIIALRRITVSGEVRQPGIYKVDPTMSVVEAMALAGGPTPSADKDTIVLIRGGTERKLDLGERIDLQAIDVRSGDQLYVPQRNWFVRNWPILGGVFSAAMSLVVILTR